MFDHIGLETASSTTSDQSLWAPLLAPLPSGGGGSWFCDRCYCSRGVFTWGVWRFLRGGLDCVPDLDGALVLLLCGLGAGLGTSGGSPPPGWDSGFA